MVRPTRLIGSQPILTYGLGTTYAGDISIVGIDDLDDVAITGAAEDDTLRYVGGEWINDNRRWEPVTDNPGGGPEIVFDGDEIVMSWAVY